MEKRKKVNIKNDKKFDSKVVSANECTGLMPSLPESHEDADALSELYDIHVSGSMEDNDDIPFEDL